MLSYAKASLNDNNDGVFDWCDLSDLFGITIENGRVCVCAGEFVCEWNSGFEFRSN